MDKIALKKAVAAFVHRARPLIPWSSSGGGVRVLNYHSIPDSAVANDRYQMTTPRALFEKHMAFLRQNGYAVLSCTEAVGMLSGVSAIPEKAVCITFDDGFRDNLTNALPVLERYRFPATFFIAADFIGRDRMYLDRSSLESLARSAVASFGAHTVYHGRMAGMPPGELDREVGASKRILEEIVRAPVGLFAYPFGCYGSFDGTVKRFVQKAGFAAAFTTIAGYNTRGTDRFELRRTRISWCDDDEAFVRQLDGAYDWYWLWQRMTGTP